MSETVRLRSKVQPENTQEFDKVTAEILVSRGRWELAGEQPAPQKPATARTRKTDK